MLVYLTLSGPFPVLSLMIGSVVEKFIPDKGLPVYNITGFEGLTQEQQRVIVASSVTFLVGLFQVAYINGTFISFRLSHLSDDIKITSFFINVIGINC